MVTVNAYINFALNHSVDFSCGCWCVFLYFFTLTYTCKVMWYCFNYEVTVVTQIIVTRGIIIK